LTTLHCILSAELTKNAFLQTVFGDFAHWVIPELYVPYRKL